jgi:hypothetical protein
MRLFLIESPTGATCSEHGALPHAESGAGSARRRSSIRSLTACSRSRLISATGTINLALTGDDLFAILRPRGLPIGNLTSQFWSNVYLNDFDWFVQRELGCAAYLRYVDDFVLFAHDKQQLWGWKERIVFKLKEVRL